MTTEKMTRAGISRRRFLGTSAGALVVAIGLDGIAGAARTARFSSCATSLRRTACHYSPPAASHMPCRPTE